MNSFNFSICILAAAAFLVLGACDENMPTESDGLQSTLTLDSHKGNHGGGGGGNGGGDDPAPVGKVYFYDAAAQVNYVTNPDGSGRTDAGIYGRPGTPSHNLYGGERWFLVERPAAGTYPDGRSRRELFLEASSGSSVRLTNEADLEILSSDRLAWIAGDAAVGFLARRISTGDCETNPVYYTEGGIYTIDITSASGTPAPSGSATLLVPFAANEWCDPAVGDPAVGDPVWSPSADSLVYADTEGVLHVKALSSGSTFPIATDAGGPLDWSVRGEILYGITGMTKVFRTRADNSGAEPVAVVEPRNKGSRYRTISYAHWSPDGNHFTYRELVTSFGSVVEGMTYVTDRNGSGKTNLTSDLEFTTPMGWR